MAARVFSGHRLGLAYQEHATRYANRKPLWGDFFGLLFIFLGRLVKVVFAGKTSATGLWIALIGFFS